eukprot:CAMPEP_0205825124 /NCGR_PEP_ID=MMETSP0206-20130828/24008_1 /ASSEMBLY_ACC=CAM_ASM_000279 /TAXON_ID=36767 /ORGANISM="Euplotes focardii, Strain TN1" /LENGTH=213 /DNA_ID=CAMNT_0053123891 /DNA_START=20 /DNA_END=661 /DNA_ORIENTATION=+
MAEVAVDVAMCEIVRSVQQVVSQHSGGGIRGIARIFKNLDQFGRNRLDGDDIRIGLRDYKIKLDAADAKLLVKAWDRSGSGTVNYDDFLVGVRGELSPTRKRYIDRAFKIMDKNKSGEIDLADIKGVYSAEHDPRVQRGEMTDEEVLTEFLQVFEGVGGNKDGIVTKEEWDNYYKAVSSSIDTDEYFVVVMKSAWKMDEYAAKPAKGEEVKED